MPDEKDIRGRGENTVLRLSSLARRIHPPPAHYADVMRAYNILSCAHGVFYRLFQAVLRLCIRNLVRSSTP
ncbi:MAG: hypothetical protein QXN19_01735 [Sulfolobales archaeon]